MEEHWEWCGVGKWSEVTQSCPTLCYPMDCSLPGSSVHGIFQARVLEWVAISFSRESSWPRDWTQVSHIAGRGFTVWATREARRGSRLFSGPREKGVYRPKSGRRWATTSLCSTPRRIYHGTDEMIGWGHQLNGHEFEQAPGDGEGQGSLVCYSPWGSKESDMTE